MEEIEIFIKGHKAPFRFKGEYLGHTRPDGKVTRNWHYYRDENGEVYHFRKTEIQLVISKEIG